jgi:hypothetical protein
MGLNNYDYAIIVVVILSVVLFVTFYTDVMGKNVSMRNNYSEYYKDKNISESICTDVNCTELNKTLTSLTKTSTSTTTSSTIKMIFFDTSGSVTSLLSTRSGDALIDCGDNATVMDKLFTSGVRIVNYVFITKMDREHAGGCARAFMSVPHNVIYDSGGNISDDWFSNYRFIAGGYRAKYSGKIIKVGAANVYPVVISDTDSDLVIKIGNNVFGVLGDCSNFGFVNTSKYDLLVCDYPMTEDDVIRSRVRFIVLRNVTADFESIAKKYGVSVMNSNAGVDWVVTTDGVRINIDRKKGL